MAGAGKQPGTHTKLTNVSIVRLRKGGKRFEIACYKNTVKAYRSGAQTDLSEVIQIENVFINVAKGQVASADDLKKAFNKTDTSEIMLEILKKGELQVGEKERALDLQDLKREICDIVSSTTVNPQTQLPYTVALIERAMADLGYNAQLNKPAKVQALDFIRKLQEGNAIPIERAKMKIRMTMAAKDGKRLKEKLAPLLGTVEDEDWSTLWEVTALIDPGSYKKIDDVLQTEIKPSAPVRPTLDMLSFSSVQAEERLE